MTVNELITKLFELPPNSVVSFHDPNTHLAVEIGKVWIEDDYSVTLTAE